MAILLAAAKKNGGYTASYTESLREVYLVWATTNRHKLEHTAIDYIYTQS